MTTETALEMRMLPFRVRLYDYTQKSRVAVERHLETLNARGQEDTFLSGTYETLRGIEDQLQGHIEGLVRTHPVWQNWAYKIKGCGPLSLGKILGRCYRVYPGSEFTKEHTACNARIPGGRCGRMDPHWHGVDQFETASQLRAHAGLAPGQHRQQGEVISWDPALKSFCWLLAKSLKMAQRPGKPPSKAYQFYVTYKDELRVRWEQALGRPLGRKTKKDELGDLDLERRASHKMLQVFLDLMWVVWRRAEGFEVRPSFAAEKLGHHDIQPEAWMD